MQPLAFVVGAWFWRAGCAEVAGVAVALAQQVDYPLADFGVDVVGLADAVVAGLVLAVGGHVGEQAFLVIVVKFWVARRDVIALEHAGNHGLVLQRGGKALLAACLHVGSQPFCSDPRRLGRFLA